jgi:hypothetical protein
MQRRTEQTRVSVLFLRAGFVCSCLSLLGTLLGGCSTTPPADCGQRHNQGSPAPTRPHRPPAADGSTGPWTSEEIHQLQIDILSVLDELELTVPTEIWPEYSSRTLHVEVNFDGATTDWPASWDGPIGSCMGVEVSNSYRTRKVEMLSKAKALARAIDLAIDHPSVTIVVRAAPIEPQPPAA